LSTGGRALSFVLCSLVSGLSSQVISRNPKQMKSNP